MVADDVLDLMKKVIKIKEVENRLTEQNLVMKWYDASNKFDYFKFADFIGYEQPALSITR